MADASPAAIGAIGGAVLVFALISLGVRLWVPRGPQPSVPRRRLRRLFDHPTFVLCSAGAEVALGIALVAVAVVRAAH